MVDNRPAMTEQAGKIVAGVIALASLIVADKVTLLHPLFGSLLFLYLTQGFTRPLSRGNRMMLSLALSFALILITCYPVDRILAKCNKAYWWDEALAIQCLFTFLLAWVIKAELDLASSEGGVS